MSGGRSNTSMGNGLASRFSLALSRVIETPLPSADLQCDDDIAEIITLVDELNQHQDLTVKLNNQSKICNIFKKGHKNTLMLKKLDKKLLDPELQAILDKCRLELVKLQEQKEEQVDEFLECHTEERIMKMRKIEKEHSKILEDIQDDNLKEAELRKQEDEMEVIRKEFNVKKNIGLNEIKIKYNDLCKKCNVDTEAFVNLIKQKRIALNQDKENNKKESSQQAEERVKPVASLIDDNKIIISKDIDSIEIVTPLPGEFSSPENQNQSPYKEESKQVKPYE